METKTQKMFFYIKKKEICENARGISLRLWKSQLEKKNATIKQEK